MHLRTDAKHFTIGSLSTPIRIAGPFKNLSVSPDVGELAVRGGAAVGLGLLFPPAAVLPTIQLGLGKNNDCGQLIEHAKDTPNPAASSAASR